jgi:hypothetical protein
MTENVRPYPQGGLGQQDQPPATTAARDEAATVGRSAGEAGGRVAQTAADQAREVVSETASQARDLLGEASGHARTQASDQQQRAARQLRSVAGELREMAARGGQSGVAAEVAQQAAERIHGAASWLEQREPADLLQAVTDFARRRPGVFLAGAVAAGLAAGRLTRGMAAAARSDGQRPGTQRPPGEIPAGAAIPPPPDPDWTTPMPGYPAAAVPGASTGTVTPGAAGGHGAEPYYPAGGVPGPGAAGPAEEIVPGSFHGRGGNQGMGYGNQGAGYADEGTGYGESGLPGRAQQTRRPGEQP